MNDLRVFPASRWKALALLLGSIAFVVLGVWMASERPVIGWLCAGFFALGIPASMAMFVPNTIYLKLDPDGFEMGTPFRKHRTLWRDVEGFELAAVKGAKMIAIIYREGYEQQALLRKASAAMAGIEGGIPNSYAASLPEILAALEQWHARYAGQRS
jgi:hypothetical protein